MMHPALRGRDTYPFLTAVFSFGLIAACVDGDEAPPAIEQPLAAWTAVRSVVIGSESSEEYALTRVGHVARTSDGRVVVAQPTESRLRIFDSDGTFRRYVGRSGEGPGEFRWYPSSLLVRNDTIWVSDGGSRLHAFTADGELIHTIPTELRPPEPYVGTGLHYRLVDGTVLVEGSGFAKDVVSGRITDLPMFRFSLDGRLIEALPGSSPAGMIVMEAPPLQAGDISIPQEAGAMVPYSRTAWAAVDPRGSSIIRVSFEPLDAEGGGHHEFTVTRLSLTGDTVDSSTLSYTPSPVPAAYAEQALDSVATSLAEQMGGHGRALQGLRDGGFRIPAFLPPIRNLVVGTEGSVWLALETGPGAEILRWLVLDPTLAPLATVELPSGLDVRHVDGTEVWGVITSDLDVPSLVLYTVGGTPEPPRR